MGDALPFGADFTVSDYAKEYKKTHPTYAPQGKVTERQIPIFTEEEVRDMPTWDQSVLAMEEEGTAKRGKHLIADSTPRLDPEEIAKVSFVWIAVEEPKGTKYYYELDPVKGGKKGTEVDMQAEGVSAPTVLPGPQLPSVKLPDLSGLKWPTIPSLSDAFDVSNWTKGIVGVVLVFIAVIIGLMALGYSGLGKSVGRVGEKAYSKKRKKK